MRLLRIGLLALVLSALLTAAVIGGYGRDQDVIRWFPGTGVAAKLDVWGPAPAEVRIQSQATGAVTSVEVWPDGTFIAQLPPGAYRLALPNDGRTVEIHVPAGECVDVILDYRLPWTVLTVPG
jgi:hypothetical protein